MYFCHKLSNMANFNLKFEQALTGFFAIQVVSCIASYLVGILGLYNPHITPIFWVLFNLISSALIFISTRNKNNFKNIVGSLAGYIVSCVLILYCINNITSLVFEKALLGVLGAGFFTCIELIEYIAFAFFLLFSKQWICVKIFGILPIIPSVISCSLSYKIHQAITLARNTMDYSIVEKISDAINISTFFLIALYLVAFVFALISIFRKPVAPSMQNQPIDLI